jgi:hypothetical protein
MIEDEKTSLLPVDKGGGSLIRVTGFFWIDAY